MSDKERLHPVAIIQHILRLLKDSIFLLIIAFVTFEFYTTLIIVAIYILLVGLGATLSWYRYSYWIDEDALHMEYGIFKRTKRTISKNRIQSIDLTENIIHRIFKLVRVQIETASTGVQSEASLAAVTLAKGQELRDNLKYKKAAADSEVILPEEPEVIVKRKITFSQLLLAGITSGGIGVIFGIIFFGLVEVEEFIPETALDATLEWLISTSIMTVLLLLILVLVVVWLLSVAWTLIRYGNFTIKLIEDELLISRGLLERKQLTIPLHRIQAVGIEENILRQPFGYASIVAEVAGGSSDKQTDASVILFPIMAKSEIPDFLQSFAPGFSWKSDQVEWMKPPKRAAKFYIIRSGILLLLVSLAVFYFLPAFTWAALLVLGLALFRGWVCYKDAGFFAEENRLLLRYRVLKRVTVVLYPKRIQAFEQNQHPLQKREQLTTLKLSIISSIGGKHYKIRELVEEDVDDLNDRYFTKKHTSQKALHSE